MEPVHLKRMVNHEAGPEVNAEPAGSLRTDDGEALLDNPILNSLMTDQSSIAIAEKSARRYPAAVGPLAGVPDQSLQSYRALGVLAGPGGVLVLFFPEPPAQRAGWSLLRGGVLTQMICRNPQFLASDLREPGVSIRKLEASDVPAMLDLTKLTEPGPFREHTIELGGFYGIFDQHRLLAMAGQRMRMPGFAEVSAVCTHPDARGRGYAGLLMQNVMREIVAEGRTPFLHAFGENPAVRLYERLGFTERRAFHLAVIRHEA